MFSHSLLAPTRSFCRKSWINPVVLDLYQKDILDYVTCISQQVSSNKAIRVLLARDHELEKKDPSKYSQEAGSKLAASSYLDTNPFGDKPMDITLFYQEDIDGGDEGNADEDEGETTKM